MEGALTARQIDPVSEMLNERSGLWNITNDRVKMIEAHASLVSARNVVALDDMLYLARSGDRVWVCKAEYYSVLVEIRKLSLEPSVTDLQEVLRNVIAGATQDRMSHRSWVKETVDILRRLTENS